MLKITNLTKKYILKDGKIIVALDDISLTLPDTGLFSVLGRNGSGKTTLLNLIGGLDKTNIGNIEYNNVDIFHFSKTELNNYRNNRISFIFQEYNLIQEYSVIENIKLAVRLQYSDEKTVSQKTEQAISSVGLTGFEKRKISELSGGQRQRVVLARALAKNSDILLCDEPTGNLDEESANDFFSLLKKISKERLVVVVTHDFEFAQKYSDDIIRLKDGKIVDSALEESFNCQNINNKNEYSYSECKNKGISFKNIIRYAWRNIRSSFFVSIAVLLIVTICFSFLLTFFSLSHFSLSIAFNNTVKANGAYMVSFTKFIDKVDIRPDGSWMYGRSLETESVSEEDISKVYEQIGYESVIYKAYIFTEYLDYLTENDVDFLPTDFYSNCFNEYICVDDFTTFHQELIYGEYPKIENQILIFDYMAENMLKHGGFPNVDSIDDFVNYNITDKYSGITYEISGILKSNYDLYRDIDKENEVHDFATKYLASLQSVVGFSSFFYSIKSLNSRENLYRSSFSWEYISESGEWEETYLTEPKSTVLRVMDENQISYLSFLGDFNPQQCDTGILISKGMLLSILGKSENIITETYIEEMLYNQSLILEMETSFVDGQIEKTSIYKCKSAVIGVYDGNSGEIIHYIDDCENGLSRSEMDFRHFYVALDGNDSKNLEIIVKLLPEEKTKEFYQSHLDYYNEGFVLNTPYQAIVEDAFDYIDGMSDVGKNLFVLSIILVFVAVAVYGSIVIKKRRFEIGLFKSLGFNNSSVVAIFGTEVAIIIITALLCSLVVSPILIGMIDNAFTVDLKFPISLFRIYAMDVVAQIIIGCSAAILALALPISKILRLQPISIMRNARK